MGTEEEAGPPRSPAGLPDHPVRAALLDLIAELGTVTSTQAAARLGHSTGVCSFHLRRLAQFGLVEEAPGPGGRARPWRLRRATEAAGTDVRGEAMDPDAFEALARGLEDESYRRWLAHRAEAPAPWRRDEAFSTVLHLTPEELAEVAEAIRELLAPYQDRRGRPAAAAPVAAVTRLFPLLAPRPDAD
nr:helix-turn-helix domain-containing protein [Streptomyces hoynatensis]